MIYPENLERKIGFTEIRTQLRGRCMSTLGTEWVDEHVNFSCDFEDVKEKLLQVVDFRRLTEEEDEAGDEQFYDVRQALMRIRPERTYMEEIELFDLKRSLQTVGSICKMVRRGMDGMEAVKYPALARMSEGIECHPEIVKMIDGVLNKYGKVKDTASAELLSIRHQIEVSNRNVNHALRAIVQEAQEEGFIDRDVTPTLRDGRLVIPVAPALKRKIRGIVHDESATGKTVFIEPAEVVEANNRVRELKAQEKREIMRILQELTSAVRPHLQDLLNSQRFLAHVDFLRALTTWAESAGAIVPHVVNGSALDLVQARHPLLQQSLERKGGKIVPLDIRLQDKQRILLISGPNAGGKSVTLKTVGLLQYMLQCGLPVTVRENSTMGVFRDIMIDIGDEQSLEDDLSTYSSHLLNMKTMMKRSNLLSLILIDEFGGGTEPQIGGALAEAILQRLVKQGAMGVITTHYQNLKHFAESTEAVVNGAMLYDRNLMQPLFVLQVGHPGSSFAIEIARKIGLPEEVISYASDLVGKDYVMSDKYLQDIVRDKVYWENKRRHIHEREKKLEATLAGYEQDMQKLQQDRKRILGDARQEAEQLLQESNARIERTIRDIKEAQAEKERTREVRQELADFRAEIKEENSANDAIERKMEQIRRRQERRAARKQQFAQDEARHEETASLQENVPGTSDIAQAGAALEKVLSGIKGKKPIEAGDTVRLKGQNTVGRVDAVTGRLARVLFGVVYTSVPIARLEHAEEPKMGPLQQSSTFVSRDTRDMMREKALHFKPEIDLRGMRGDEALTHVSLFIDDAIQCEQSRVRILHGTGTGALRQMVRQYLGTVPGVKKFHDEHVQFGGAGITVVEFE